MSRPSQNNKTKGESTSPTDLLDIIIGDVIATQSLSAEAWWAQNRDQPFVGLAIPAGQSREYRVSQVGVDAAHGLTKQSWDMREDLRQRMDRDAFNKASFMAIGEAITSTRKRAKEEGSSERDGDTLLGAMLADYLDNLDQLAAQQRNDADRHIPCALFDRHEAVPPFAVGPVQFSPRADWIGQTLDMAVAEIVRAVDERTRSADAVRDEAYSSGSDPDARIALDVLDFLRGYGWVGTVRIADHESERAQEKASLLIGLAIDALGLRFHAGDALSFVKADRAHLAGDIRFATTPTGGILRGSRSHRAGLGGPPGKLNAKLAAERPYLDAVGAILEAYVEARQRGRAPHIIERWVNALYWIGDARREASDFMAVVNYGCALDGLTGAGGNIGPMTDFAVAALHPVADAPQTRGITVKAAVRRVYAEGRNKLAHGEMPGLLEDLSEVRRLGDEMLVHLFDRVTFDLAEVVRLAPHKLTIPSAHAIKGQIARLAQR